MLRHFPAQNLITTSPPLSSSSQTLIHSQLSQISKSLPHSFNHSFNMPSIISTNGSSTIFAELEANAKRSIRSEETHMKPPTPRKRSLRSNSMPEDLISPISSPPKHLSSPVWKSPRRCISSSPNANPIGIRDGFVVARVSKSPRKRLADSFEGKPKWNLKDREQICAVKEVLHVSTAPSAVVCREEEQNRVLEFCRGCVVQEKGGSLYLCGCPGTGKTLSMEKVRRTLLGWAKEAGFQQPNVLAMNCTSLANTSDVFGKVLELYQPRKKTNGASSALQNLKNLFSKQSSGGKMTLIIADELDYLITRDRSVLHDLFMLTTLSFSTCILIGIANAIDLADRFLPKLQALNWYYRYPIDLYQEPIGYSFINHVFELFVNQSISIEGCNVNLWLGKPLVVTFRAYSKDQILRIIQQRLVALSFNVFHPLALELCARKVAAASGDMRKALCVCRSAIEMLEAELKDAVIEMNLAPTAECAPKQEAYIVGINHMALALSKAFKSPVVDTIQSLPQHQQMILCSMVKLIRRDEKDTTVGELNKSYSDICKSTEFPSASFLEFSNMCSVLNDQGLLKIGHSGEGRLRRVTLKVDKDDVTFALQGIRFFRNCHQ